MRIRHYVIGREYNLGEEPGNVDIMRFVTRSGAMKYVDKHNLHIRETKGKDIFVEEGILPVVKDGLLKIVLGLSTRG